MTKSEKETLVSICRDIEDSDDKIDALERLYFEIKRMVAEPSQLNELNIRKDEEKNISGRRIVDEYWADGEWHYD